MLGRDSNCPAELGQAKPGAVPEYQHCSVGVRQTSQFFGVTGLAGAVCDSHFIYQSEQNPCQFDLCIARVTHIDACADSLDARLLYQTGGSVGVTRRQQRKAIEITKAELAHIKVSVHSSASVSIRWTTENQR